LGGYAPIFPPNSDLDNRGFELQNELMMQYQPPYDYLFLDKKRKMKLVSGIKQNIVKFDIKPENVGFCFSPNLSTES